MPVDDARCYFLPLPPIWSSHHPDPQTKTKPRALSAFVACSQSPSRPDSPAAALPESDAAMSGKERAVSWAKPPAANLTPVGRAKDIFWMLLDPWMFMGASLYYLPGTVGHLVKRRDFATLFSWDALQTKWFGRFWVWAGPMVRRTGEERVVPLLEGRVQKGVIHDRPVVPGVHGVVVEVGAGSGMWIDLFKNDYHGKWSLADSAVTSGLDESSYELTSRRSASGEVLGRSRVTKVYGVEPNPQSHEALVSRVKASGLEDIYEVVPVGIEHLGGGHWKWEKPIEKESVDCIVTILCLCSIPDPVDNIRDLYNYLKPGGRWYLYEHVCCTKEVSSFMFWYQCEHFSSFFPSSSSFVHPNVLSPDFLHVGLINLIWPHIMGGCSLRRDTASTVRNAGTWSEIDISRPDGEAWYHAAPHLLGVLRK